MKVSFNPVNNNYSFKSKSVSKDETLSKPTTRQITDAKIKKTVSEASWVAFGVVFLYFFAKISGKKLHANTLNKENKSLKETVKKVLSSILPSKT